MKILNCENTVNTAIMLSSMLMRSDKAMSKYTSQWTSGHNKQLLPTLMDDVEYCIEKNYEHKFDDRLFECREFAKDKNPIAFDKCLGELMTDLTDI